MVMSEAEARQAADGQTKDHAIPEFYWHAVVNQEATDADDGIKTFKDVLYIKITKPGVHGQEWAGKAKPEHIARFQKAHDAFMADEGPVELDGYPIKESTMFSEAERKNLKLRGFITVNSLADAPDAALKGMGMRDMSNRAKRFIENLEGPAAASNRLDTLEKRLVDLEFQAEEAKATIKALKSENTKLKNKAVKEDA